MPMFSEQDNPASFSPYLLTRYDDSSQTKVFKSVVLMLHFPTLKWFADDNKKNLFCCLNLITSPYCSV